jgi:hypothetical protein
MIRQSVWFALCLFCLSSAVLAQRIHPKLKEGKTVLQRIVVLPAQVSLVKDGMKGQEPMEKEAAAAQPVIEQAVAKALVNKQLNVLDSPFKPEALQNDEKLKYALADLQRNYDELHPKIAGKQKDIEKGRFTLGDQVLLLNQDDNIDAFVFVHALGVHKTGGKKALALVTLSPLMMLPIYTVTLTVADARTGEILAQTNAYTVLDITKQDDKKLVDLLTKRLKKLPAATTAKKS